jgi:hypothetical protein
VLKVGRGLTFPFRSRKNTAEAMMTVERGTEAETGSQSGRYDLVRRNDTFAEDRECVR